MLNYLQFSRVLFRLNCVFKLKTNATLCAKPGTFARLIVPSPRPCPRLGKRLQRIHHPGQETHQISVETRRISPTAPRRFLSQKTKSSLPRRGSTHLEGLQTVAIFSKEKSSVAIPNSSRNALCDRIAYGFCLLRVLRILNIVWFAVFIIRFVPDNASRNFKAVDTLRDPLPQSAQQAPLL